ncbi:MAG: hypothetical protein ACOH1T_01955 [Microbacteriaceae bacterium]
MAIDDDDAALNWDGDEAEIAAPRARTAGTPDAPTDQDGAADAGDEVVPPATSSIQLVTYGILAGAYLLYTVGWAFTVARSGLFSTNLLVEIMSQFSEFLAIIAAPLWFVLVFILTKNSRTIVRSLWLVVGLFVLMPVPFILGGV